MIVIDLQEKNWLRSMI